jgi:hypothetical protein
MTKYDDALSPFTGAMERRSLLKLFGRSAIAIAGSAAPRQQVGATAIGRAKGLLAPRRRGKKCARIRAKSTLTGPHSESAFELSKPEVDRLKTAYAALRKLAVQHPDDPRGWLRQGHVHCWYCGGGTNGRSARISMEAGYFCHGIARFFIFTSEPKSVWRRLARC